LFALGWNDIPSQRLTTSGFGNDHDHGGVVHRVGWAALRMDGCCFIIADGCLAFPFLFAAWRT